MGLIEEAPSPISQKLFAGGKCQAAVLVPWFSFELAQGPIAACGSAANRIERTTGTLARVNRPWLMLAWRPEAVSHYGLARLDQNLGVADGRRIRPVHAGGEWTSVRSVRLMQAA